MQQPSEEMANIEFSHTEEGDLVLIFRGVKFDRQLRSAFRELGKNAHAWAKEFRNTEEKVDVGSDN